jgi:hypothetical protein
MKSNTLNHIPKKKLTDAERHKRFVETAKKVEASDKIEDFDRAFMDIMENSKSTEPRSSKKPQH